MTGRKRARVTAGAVAYVDSGTGPAVLLLHGFPTSADLWRDLIPLLAPRFRVVAPDLLGYGASDVPGESDLGAGSQAAHVRELLAALGIEEVAAVGHGLGGAVAQLLARDGVARTLVLLDSVTVDVAEHAERMVEGFGGAGEADAAAAEKAVRMALERGMGHPERLPAEDVERFAAPWRADPKALARAARAADQALDPPAAGGAAADVPAFIVWGDDDPFLPASAGEGLQDALPGSTLALLPGCSHFVLQDAPDTVAPMVAEFLRLRYLGEGHRHAPGPTPLDLGATFERPEGPPPWPDEEG